MPLSQKYNRDNAVRLEYAVYFLVASTYTEKFLGIF
jgi:hypothetical protein